MQQRVRVREGRHIRSISGASQSGTAKRVPARAGLVNGCLSARIRSPPPYFPKTCDADASCGIGRSCLRFYSGLDPPRQEFVHSETKTRNVGTLTRNASKAATAATTAQHNPLLPGPIRRRERYERSSESRNRLSRPVPYRPSPFRSVPFNHKLSVIRLKENDVVIHSAAPPRRPPAAQSRVRRAECADQSAHAQLHRSGAGPPAGRQQRARAARRPAATSGDRKSIPFPPSGAT